MYVDPITRQTFNYANQILWEKTTQNVIALDPDTNQYYVPIHNLLKKTFLYSLNHFKLKLLLVQTPLLPKLQVFLLKKTQTFLESSFIYKTLQQYLTIPR